MFELVNNKVVIPPSSLTVPEMKAVWDRDKTKGKEIAYMELCYIYHMSDVNSEYANYDESVRVMKVRHDQIKEERWSPDEIIDNAIFKYKEMRTTASSRFLDSQQGLLDKITAIIKELDGEDLEDDKKMNSILASSDKATKIILTLPKLKQQVAKEQSELEHIRGGGVAGAYEE